MNNAKGFFKTYLAVPVVILFWLCAHIWKGKGWLKLRDIDVDAGRREIDWEAHNRVMEKRRTASPWMRIVYFLF